VATMTACPFCFHKIDSSNLAFQCSGRGNEDCVKDTDEARIKLTGNHAKTFLTFMPDKGRTSSAICPQCGGEAKRRACPACHTALPLDFVGSRNPMIGLVGSKGSGKTVLMVVLVKQMREVIGRRYDADIRIATDNPDGQQGLSTYKENREKPLFSGRTLPQGTSQLAARQYATPIVLRWRSRKSTMLSFVDSAGEDLNDTETVFTLQYLSVCDSLIIALDPFALPGARARLKLPEAATQVDDDVPLDVVSRITEILRTEHKVKDRKKIGIPVAIVFTKIDAFYPTLDQHNPIMAAAPALPSYNNADGEAVHEHMRALLDEWGADDIDRHMRQNYGDYRYFAVSALGAEPDYTTGEVAAGGVQPHRVEDPVLWLLSKARTVKSA
jgi:ABC-type dipeptide/oligopeptide/nickel transport system ATPase component